MFLKNFKAIHETAIPAQNPHLRLLGNCYLSSLKPLAVSGRRLSAEKGLAPNETGSAIAFQ